MSISRRLSRAAIFALKWATLSACTTFVVAIGYELQRYTVAFVTGESSTLYGRLYGHGIISFGSLSDWLVSALNWITLAMGAAIAVFVVFQKYPKRALVVGALATFAVLTVADVIFSAMAAMLTPKELFESVIFNAVGAVMASGVVFFSILLADFVFKHLPRSPVRINLISFVVPALFGMVFSGVFYYCARYLLEPVPVDVRAHLGAPSSGTFGADRPVFVPDARTARDVFSIFPTNVGSAQIWLRDGAGNVGVDWTKLRPMTRYEIEISIYDGCDYFHRDVLPAPQYSYTLDNAELLSFSAPDGPVNTAFGGADSSTDIEVIGSEVAFFGIRPGNDAGTIDASQFLQDGIVRVWDTSGVQQVRFAVPTLADEGATLHQATRILSFSLNGKRMQFEVEPGVVEGPPGCKELPASDFLEGKVSKISSTAGHIIVAMNFRPSDGVKAPYGARAGMLSASGLSGWLEIVNLPNSNFVGSIASGRLLAFEGEVLRLTINGVERPASKLSHFSGWGEFSGTRDQDGQVIFEGNALGFWEEEVRLNPTRWEQLSAEVQIFLGGLILSGLGVGILLIANTARANKIMAWLSLRS